MKVQDGIPSGQTHINHAVSGVLPESLGNSCATFRGPVTKVHGEPSILLSLRSSRLRSGKVPVELLATDL